MLYAIPLRTRSHLATQTLNLKRVINGAIGERREGLMAEGSCERPWREPDFVYP